MPSNLSGQIFGHYKLGEMLGTGGMSLVYRARQLNIERDVAIKILAPALSNQDGFVRRFKQEVEIFAKLEHPHIVPIYDYNQHEKYLYLVLRLLNGGSLSDHLDEHDTMNLQRIARIIEQVASALNHAHDENIIHRDLKPGNILLDDEDNAYVTDFGISKIISETKGGAMSALLGTPAYIAPEQWQTMAVDKRADIYSLGMIVYKLITGVLPFAKSSPFYLMYSHLHEEIAKPSKHRDNLSPEIDAVVLKSLAKKPEDRYENATDFAAALTKAVEDLGKSADPTDRTLLDPTGIRSFRPDSKKDTRLDKLWIALERSSGHVFVTPDVEELFRTKDEKRTAKMNDIWDELERPTTAVYDTRRLQSLLDQIKKEHAFLGVKTQRVGLPDHLHDAIGQESGLLLIAVEQESPAEACGLYLGDLLLKLDGQALKHQDDLIDVLNDERIEKNVKIEFLRTGTVQHVDAALIKRESGKASI